MSNTPQVYCAYFRRSSPGLVVAIGMFLAGCTVAPNEAEKSARREVAAIGTDLGIAPADSRRPPVLSELRPDSTEADYVRYAVYHHPAVRAAYYEWQASVDAIAPNRAFADPQLTFQADIADTLMSFMPGVMFDVMGAGRRRAMAAEATAASSAAYRDYVVAVVKTAAAVRKAWIDLAYAQDTDALYRQTIHAAEQAVALAANDYTTAQGMVSFDQQVRFQNLVAQHHAHHQSVTDRITAARAKLKSALGLLPTDADPVWPSTTLAVTSIPSEADIWTAVVTHNPDLAKMRTMVDMALAGVVVANKGGTPDFTVGTMVDLKQNPLMFRPTATMTLPIWREKIRANIDAARARRAAAEERVTAEQLSMAAELAQMLYMLKESDAMLAYMNDTALPNLDRSLASAEAASQSGMGNTSMIAEVQLMTIDMKHESLDALRDRESAAVDVAIMMAEVLPPRIPLVAEARGARADR